MSDADKPALRKEVWSALQAAGAGRFPGIRGRIPNFKGAEAAAEHMAQQPWFRRAKALKCNPDSPQRRVRYLALKAGKTVFMAVPRLRDVRPFLALEPERLSDTALWEASSIKGAEALGRLVAAEDMPKVDLIVTGCVATSLRGERLGKGGGFSDLEYAVLRRCGIVGPRTPVATTVHPSQLLVPGRIPLAAHDLSLDWVVTPSEVLRVQGRARRSGRIHWGALSEAKIAEVPLLARLRSEGG